MVHHFIQKGMFIMHEEINDMILSAQLNAGLNVENALAYNIEKIEEMARYNPRYTYTNYNLNDMYVEYCNIVANNSILLENNLNVLMQEYFELTSEIQENETITESVDDWRPVTFIGKIIKFIVKLVKSFVNGVKSLFTRSNTTSRGATSTPEQCAQKVFGPPKERVVRRGVAHNPPPPPPPNGGGAAGGPPPPPPSSPKKGIANNPQKAYRFAGAGNNPPPPKNESEVVVIKAMNKDKPVEFKEVFEKKLIGDVIKIKNGSFVIDMTGLNGRDDPKQKNLDSLCKELTDIFSLVTFKNHAGTKCEILSRLIRNVSSAFEVWTGSQEDAELARSISIHLKQLNEFAKNKLARDVMPIKGVKFLDDNGSMRDIGASQFATCSSQITKLGQDLENLNDQLNKKYTQASRDAGKLDQGLISELKTFEKTVTKIMDKLTGVVFGLTSLQQAMRSKWVVDMRYKHICDNLDELSRFVEMMINAGVPGNYVGINAYYVMTPELNGGEGMNKPDWGLSRIAFKPKNDQNHVIKIALNITGINSIKHEREFADNLRAKYGNKTFKITVGNKTIEQTVVDSFALPDRTKYGNSHCVCKFEKAATRESGEMPNVNWSGVGQMLHNSLVNLGVPEGYVRDCHAGNVGYIKAKNKFVFIDYSLG